MTCYTLISMNWPLPMSTVVTRFFWQFSCLLDADDRDSLITLLMLTNISAQ